MSARSGRQVRACRLQHAGIPTGVILFVLGLAFIIADVTPFFAGDYNTPLWLNLACLLAPTGFAVAVWSGLRAGRDEQRAAARELDGSDVAD